MKPEVIYLDVPFREKDDAKELGARWDAEERKWYIPKGKDSNPFQQWFQDESETL